MERTEEEEKEKSVDKEEKPFVLGEDDKKSDGKELTNTAEEGKPLDLPISKEQMELQKKAKEYLAAKNGNLNDMADTISENVNTAGEEEGEVKKKGRKRKRTKEFDDDSSEESSEDEVDDDVPPGMEKKVEPEKKDVESDDITKDNDSECVNELKEEVKGDENEVEENETNEQDKDEVDKEKDLINDIKTENDTQDNNLEEVDGMKPRPLHKVTSIFLRNLSPTITKQEVEAMCRRYPGFLRAAIADPSPERRWFRRGWVTFERDIKIKDICFNLNNIRLR